VLSFPVYLRHTFIMARTKDEGWARFELELSHRKTRELAAELRVEGTVVTAWKAGRSRPRFRDLPQISAVLYAGNPTRLAQLMGMVPDDDDVLATLTSGYMESMRLDELIEKRRELLRSTPSDSAPSIVAAATRTGRWAVGVWPAFEGPPGCKLHVSDRLDFHRTDGGEATEAALRSDLGPYLDEFNAVRTTPPPHPRFDGRSPGQPDTAEHWSTYRFLADRPPTRDVIDSDVTSIAVVASSVHAWTADCAAILSRILGYGLVSTRSLAAQARQGPRADEGALALRLRFHRRLLAVPPQHSVWHHFGHFSNDVWQFLPNPGDSSWPRGLVIVRLRETDALLQFASADERRRALFDDEHVALRAAIDQIPPRSVIELAVDHPVASDGSELELASRRNARLTQALRLAGEVSREMCTRGLMSAERLHEAVRQDKDPDRRQIVAWLHDQGII
jgi:predicted transcriptional regulator